MSPRGSNRPRAYSSYTLEAVQLLGELIRISRRGRGWTQVELAERAGISRRTLQKIERGDPAATIGLVFELAALVGVPLFQPDNERLSMDLDRAKARSALLPKRVVPPARG